MTECPRCGAPMNEGQDWCLACGAAVSTRIAPRPGWRAPVAVASAVLLIVAGALALAFLELSDDAERTARAPVATPTTAALPASPTPSAAPTGPSGPTGATGVTGATGPDATPTPDLPPGIIPSPTPSGTSTPSTGTVADWPAGEEAWTVVILSTTAKADADKRAKELAAQGTPVGVLRSNEYSSLRSGYWVVFSGQYETSKQAQDAAAGIGAKAAGAYARFVKPR